MEAGKEGRHNSCGTRQGQISFTRLSSLCCKSTQGFQSSEADIPLARSKGLGTQYETGNIRTTWRHLFINITMCLSVVFVDRTLLPGLSSRWRKKSTVMEGQEVRVMSMPSLILNRMKGCRGTCQYSRDGVACRRDRVSFHWRLFPGRCAGRGRLWFTLGRRRPFLALRPLRFTLGRRRPLLGSPSFLCTTGHDGAVVRESVRFKK